MNVTAQVELTEIVPGELAGERFDRIAAELFDEFSRSRLQKWINDGHLKVDGEVVRPRDKLAEGAELRLSVVLEDEGDWQPESMPLEIVHEDESLIVVDKPADLVVHPGAGNRDGTLLNGLLYRYPELINLPRAGIVHRLDKDTSGLMVVARTLQAHTHLVDQLQARSVSREYLALVNGTPVAGATIRTCYGRHPNQRLKMAVLSRGKDAITHFRIERRFPGHTLLKVNLETGRTHQIRVHLAHIKLPIVGDPLYGGRPRIPSGTSEKLRAALQQFPRQALHAARLELDHPVTGERCAWHSDIPADIEALLEILDEA